MDNIDDLLKQYTLMEVCALQWKACVDRAEDDFSHIHHERIIKVKYEEFVSDPVAEFARLAEFLNKDVPDSVNEYLRKNVRPNSVGKGRSALGEADVEKLRLLISSTLERYDYE